MGPASSAFCPVHKSSHAITGVAHDVYAIPSVVMSLINHAGPHRTTHTRSPHSFHATPSVLGAATYTDPSRIPNGTSREHQIGMAWSDQWLIHAHCGQALIQRSSICPKCRPFFRHKQKSAGPHSNKKGRHWPILPTCQLVTCRDRGNRLFAKSADVRDGRLCRYAVIFLCAVLPPVIRIGPRRS